jgi:predicted metalloprotease with PDZ domain
MKTPTIWIALLLPMLFGTACSNSTGKSWIIVKVGDRVNQTGWLGVSIQDMTKKLAKAMDVKTDKGALVNEVVEDSPAEEAGLKEEDIIVELDGRKVSDADDLRSAVRSTKPGTKVSLAVMRNGERKTFDITIGKTPSLRSYSYSFTPPRMPKLPHLPRGPMHIEIFRDAPSLGMRLYTLNKQLGKYFGAPDGRGVLVEEVEPDSKAEKAGFQAGDVLTKIDKESIEESHEVAKALRDHDEGEKVDIEIIRKGVTKTLTLEVPNMKRHHRHWFGLGDNEEWFEDFNMEFPDYDRTEEGQRGLKQWLHDLKNESDQVIIEIRRRVEQLRRELKVASSGSIS